MPASIARISSSWISNCRKCRGLEITKWIKEDDDLRTIPVIAITAFAMKGDEERIRQGGCEAYLSKPISVTKFIETVKVYLGDA